MPEVHTAASEEHPPLDPSERGSRASWLRNISCIHLIFVIGLGFLPWIEIHCNSGDPIPISGYQLATLAARDNRADTEFGPHLVVVFFLFVLISLGVGILRRSPRVALRNQACYSGIATGILALLMCIQFSTANLTQFKVSPSKRGTAPSRVQSRMEYTPWLWMTLGASSFPMFAFAMESWLRQQAERRSRPPPG
jgi:hypothetical protein